MKNERFGFSFTNLPWLLGHIICSIIIFYCWENYRIVKIILIPCMLFLFSSFNHSKEYFTLVSDRNMALKEIDGSLLEGGGQILRLSIAFSCLLEQPIRITKIRAGRSNPGLKPQHLAGIHLVKRMCNAVTHGDQQNSCELLFQPKTLKMGNFNLHVNPRTAASIPLMIQSALPVAIFSKHSSSMTLKGGTDVSFAPPMDYVQLVLFPIYKLFGIYCEAHINKRGFYPKGQGEVLLTVNPVADYLKPIELNNFEDHPIIKGIIFISGPKHEDHRDQAAQDITERIINKLKNSGYDKVTIESKVEDSDGFGGSVVLIASTGKCLIGSSALYDMRKTTTVDIADEVCDKLLLDLEMKSCVDANTMDNLIIFMALANGQSRVKCREITLHTKTAIHIAEQFTNAKFSIKQMGDGLQEITCEGIGLKII